MLILAVLLLFAKTNKKYLLKLFTTRNSQDEINVEINKKFKDFELLILKIKEKNNEINKKLLSFKNELESNKIHYKPTAPPYEREFESITNIYPDNINFSENRIKLGESKVEISGVKCLFCGRYFKNNIGYQNHIRAMLKKKDPGHISDEILH